MTLFLNNLIGTCDLQKEKHLHIEALQEDFKKYTFCLYHINIPFKVNNEYFGPKLFNKFFSIHFKSPLFCCSHLRNPRIYFQLNPEEIILKRSKSFFVISVCNFDKSFRCIIFDIAVIIKLF